MKCYVTYHPSAVLYGGFHLEQRIEDDFRRLGAKTLQTPSIGTPKTEILGFDTEYSPTGSLLTLGLSDGNSAVAADVTAKSEVAAIKKQIKKAKKIIGHSVAGDLDYLVKLGIAKEKWLRGIDISDSLLLARMHDENRGKGAYGLESLLLSEFNFAEWKAETAKLLKETGNAADWTPEQRVTRCRLDAWATKILADYFEAKLDTTRN